MRLIFIICSLGVLTVADTQNMNAIFVSANYQFTMEMFFEVTKINPRRSVVLSAFSVMSPLAQLALASEGTSHDEILHTIGFPNDNVTKQVFRYVNRKLRNIEGVELKMANRVYVTHKAELSEEFKRVSRHVFGTDFKNVDFSNRFHVANDINAWVERHTNKRIKNLISPEMLSAYTTAVLVNTIYFKGAWKMPFDEQKTKYRDFYVSNHKTIQVPTMYSRNKYKYAESAELGAKLIELPYRGENCSMLVIVPNKIDGLSALEEKLKNKPIVNKALHSMRILPVRVHLPKFKIETNTNLKDVLKKMGIKNLFTHEAQLTKLTKTWFRNVVICEAIQKAFLEVNEIGSEAGAANRLGKLLREPMANHTFYADRPFYYTIRVQGYDFFDGHFIK